MLLPERVAAIDQEILAVDRHAATLPDVADQVPVDRGLVPRSGIRVAVAEGHVDRATDLLVEQDLLREAVQPEIGAEGDLTEITGAVVGIERGDQDVLVLARRRLDDLTAVKPEADIGDL